MDRLRENDNRFIGRSYNNWEQLPQLPELSEIELRKILSQVSQHKAITSFPIPDEYIRYILDNNLEMTLATLWDPKILNRFPQIFKCKLVPLNKAHPQVPTKLQMRPIVATNVLFKILELRFTEDLQEKFWRLEGYALSQFGFLKHLSTQAQICNLLSQVTSEWKRSHLQHLHRHIPSLDPRLNRYNPCHNYIIFVDYKEAYNSINMSLLFEKMKEDQILEENKLIFLFTIYSRIKIELNKEAFTPRNGVPQGGINSPILFNYAMFYYLTEASNQINSKIQFECGFLNTPNVMTPEKNFLFADDLASLIKAHPNRAKQWIKIYFETLIEVGDKWGLHINFNKSAVMDFFSQKTSYDYLSDEKTIWDKANGTILKLNIAPNGKETTISVPLVPEYKYLGIRITRDLTPHVHLRWLKKKILFIINAFKSTGGASNNLKFCVNTWHVFIRPLLDYCQIYFSFLEVDT